VYAYLPLLYLYKGKIIMQLSCVQVTWRKLGAMHPMTIGVSTFVSDRRVKVETVHRDNEWNLVISHVKHEDEGIYQCQINTKDDQSNFYNIYLHIKSRRAVLSFALLNVVAYLYFKVGLNVNAIT